MIQSDPDSLWIALTNPLQCELEITKKICVEELTLINDCTLVTGTEKEKTGVS